MQSKLNIDFKIIVESVIEAILIVGSFIAIIFILLHIRVVAHENYSTANQLIIESKDNFINKDIVLYNIEKVPLKHIQIITDNNLKIEISKEKVDTYNKENNRNAAGYAHSVENKIYLSPNLYYIGANSLHEIGHALCWYTNKPYNTEEFKQIFDSEKHNIREYSQENIREYFADLYMIQFNNKIYEFKKKDFPKSIEYMQGLTWW